MAGVRPAYLHQRMSWPRWAESGPMAAEFDLCTEPHQRPSRVGTRPRAPRDPVTPERDQAAKPRSTA